MEPLRYVSSDQVRFHQSLYLPPRRISTYRFLFVESGHGEFRISGKRFDVRPKWLGMLSPGMRENRYFQTQPVSYLYVEFASKTPLTNQVAVEFENRGPHRSALIGLMKSINSDRKDSGGCLLSAAVRLMFPEDQRDTWKHIDARLVHVLQFLDQDPSQNPTVAELADRAGLSEPHLRRLFRRYCGVSPKQYLLRLRMQFAQRLLRYEGLRVGEVADLLGFNSVFQFSAQYRQVMGHSPSGDRSRC